MLQDGRCIVMKDDVTKVEIRKTKGDGVSMLAGASLQLLDESGTAVASWTSTEEAYTAERLPVGVYTLREISAPSGYRKGEDMRLEILDTPDLQSFVMINERKPGSFGGGGGNSETAVPSSVPEAASPALTGDAALPALWFCLACAAAAGIAFTVRKRK